MRRGHMGKVVQLTEQNAKLEDFELFWEMYPRKKKKGDAFKAWNQTSGLRPPIEEILAAIQQQEKSHQWTKDGGEFIPYPASWLRSWGWADED
jgi:hypothetical protein